MRCCVVVLMLLGLAAQCRAQEFNCRVAVQAPTIQNLDPAVLQQLQQDISQYINNRRWTDDRYDPTERIKCSFTLVLQTYTAPDRFTGTLQVQGIRPVYNSTYETLVLNFEDKDLAFNYLPSNPLIYSESTYNSQLTALLNFYALMLLGLDYDSFSLAGGTPFYLRAQNIANQAQSTSELGWHAFDGVRNRYWLQENLLNNSYRGLRELWYTYHRLGLDLMAGDAAAGREGVLKAILILQKLFQGNPTVYAIRVFMDTKTNELAQVFANGTPQQKQQFLEVMGQVDPINLTTYESVNSTGK